MRLSPFVLLALSVPYLLCLDGNLLSDGDEGFYAAMAKHMVETGDYLTPRLASRLWFDKPPLGIALEAWVMKALGVGELAVRLPAVAMAFALVAVLFVATRAVFGGGTAALTAIAAASMPMLALSVRDVKLDAAFVSFSTLAFAGFLRLLSPPRARWWWAVAAGAGLAGAALSKGITGLGVPVVVMGVTALLHRDLGLLWRARPVLVALVALPPVGTYFYTQAKSHPQEFLGTQLLWSNLERYSKTNMAGFDSTPGYYLHTLLWAAAPWIIVVYGAILYAVLKKRPWVWRLPEPPVTFLYAWLLVFLAVFSFSLSKLPQYIFPVLPAVAVLAALAWPRTPGRWQAALATSTVVAAAIFSVFVFAFGFPSPAWLVLSVVPIGLGVWLWRAGPNLERSTTAIALSMAFALAIFSGWVTPQMNPYKPMTSVVRVLDGWGKPVTYLHQIPSGSLDFYAHNQVVEVNDPGHTRLALENGAAVVAVTERLAELSQGLAVEVAGPFPYYPSHRAGGKFLFAPTRPSVLMSVSVARLVPSPEGAQSGHQVTAPTLRQTP